jgi:hypothetical protein
MLKKTRTEPQGDKHTSPRLGLYLPPDLNRALREYTAKTYPPCKMTAVVTLAVKEFLERQGAYPPK